MTRAINAKALYSVRGTAYARFISWVRYPQGIRDHLSQLTILRSGLRVLDAGCGDGVVTFALQEILRERGLRAGRCDAFDLTPAMLNRFRARIDQLGWEGIRLCKADVLNLERLPRSWTGYDLIVSSAMLEYIPKSRLPEALRALRRRLTNSGTLILFITRRNWVMQPLIRHWWHANLYTRKEISEAVAQASLSCCFHRFRFPYVHLNLWGHIIEIHPKGESN